MEIPSHKSGRYFMHYLNELTKGGYLERRKFGPANYYINTRLFDLLLTY